MGSRIGEEEHGRVVAACKGGAEERLERQNAVEGIAEGGGGKSQVIK